ncbi:MAG: CBS domain-containing protein [Sandaracinaceae bacterium]|nr:CBS domain-containing protein [Sandaracinaceae bacterium]
MSRRVIVIGPSTPLAAAWDIMVTCRIRHLPVVRDGLLLGIVSDRDALLHSKATEDAIVPPSIPVSEIMSPFPYVCDPSTHVADIVRTMTEQKIDAMPVLDAEEKLIGLVTSTDLLLLLIQYDEARPLPFEWELERHPSSSVG